jgi:catechol 2,3-dioxygenase-like lactoylglutathione lyase family enzyme
VKSAGPDRARRDRIPRQQEAFSIAQTLVREVNIVIVRVPDIAAARAFYGETLGLPIKGETPNFLVVDPIDGQGASFGVGVGEPGGDGPEIWWRVDDADAFHAALVARGVRITEEPEDRPFGRALSFTDPAGNILHAYQPR